MRQCPECRRLYPSESSYCFVDGASLVALRGRTPVARLAESTQAILGPLFAELERA